MLVWFCIRAKLRAHTLRHPCLARSSRCIDPLYFYNLLKSTSIASPRAKLASLVKGRWIDGKPQTVALLRFACDTSAFFIHQTFRRQDGGIATPLLPKTALSLSLFVGEGLVSRVTWFTLCASTWFTCYQ